ncbi:MAG: AI-2E family transporter [Actinomycetota bacterium]|nr:AI-2E family transporter [Actinomycetota bacterium]
MTEAGGLDRQPVDVRRVATITTVVLAVTVLFGGSVYLLFHLSRIVTLLVVTLFFTVVLTPAVDHLQHRAHLRRGVATAIVFLLGLLILAGLTYVFVRPLVSQGQKFADDLPHYLRDARRGRGTVGHLVKRFKLETYVKHNSKPLQDSIKTFGSKGFTVVRGIFNGLVAGITVMVLTVLMLLQGPVLGTGFLNLVPDRHRERVRRVASDAAKAVSGYMAGNLLISLIAGAATYVFLLATGVPYAEVLALWVAFADLIPLVGATLGAIPSVGIAFIHSTPVGIATIVFFVAYQQFENHVLQVTVMARTVNVNPLGILVSVLVGVELFGLLGALLAIPAAGVLQVIIRDVYDQRGGRLLSTPTVGNEEIPHDEAATDPG